MIAAAANNYQQDEKNQHQSEIVEVSVKDAAHVINILLLCVKPLVLTSITYGFLHRADTGIRPFFGRFFSM
jgi:hypothetical protein